MKQEALQFFAPKIRRNISHLGSRQAHNLSILNDWAARHLFKCQKTDRNHVHLFYPEAISSLNGI
jgi:hypothetical protein